MRRSSLYYSCYYNPSGNHNQQLCREVCREPTTHQLPWESERNLPPDAMSTMERPSRPRLYSHKNDDHGYPHHNTQCIRSTNYPEADLVSNFCRNPDGDRWPWCFYEFSGNSGHKWHYCDVPECPPVPNVIPDLGCYDAMNASAYRGSASITLSGFACQNWDVNTPNIHTFHSYRNPSLAELGHHNFCRAPLGDTMPWCFTTNPDYRWEYCDVDPCGDQPTTAVMSTTMQPTPDSTTVSTSVPSTVPSTVQSTVSSTVPSTVPTTVPSTTERTTAPTTSSNPNECGKPSFDILPNPDRQRIVGGFNANKGSLPWIVALRRYPSFSFSCGGSIIDKNWILTAAHCVRNIPGNYRAILGNYLNYEIDDEEKVVGFSRFFIHEEYDSTLLINDIALLKLSEPLVFNNFIKPVCLPDYNPGVPYVDGDAVLISGWGTLKSGGSLPNILQQAYVNIVSLTECSRRYGQQFSSDVMCAGVQQGGIDTCQGDSGGPLLDPNGNVQLGVVSWGRGCARAQYPGIYTSVSYFRNWIDNIRNNY